MLDAQAEIYPSFSEMDLPKMFQLLLSKHRWSDKSHQFQLYGGLNTETPGQIQP